MNEIKVVKGVKISLDLTQVGSEQEFEDAVRMFSLVMDWRNKMLSKVNADLSPVPLVKKLKGRWGLSAKLIEIIAANPSLSNGEITDKVNLVLDKPVSDSSVAASLYGMFQKNRLSRKKDAAGIFRYKIEGESK